MGMDFWGEEEILKTQGKIANKRGRIKFSFKILGLEVKTVRKLEMCMPEGR